MEIQPTEQNFEKPHIPDDVYHAELKDVKDVSEGEYGPRVALIFTVYHSETEQPVELAKVCNKSMTTGSNLGISLKALGAEVSENVNTDNYIGNPCRLSVESYEKDGNQASGIDKVLAPIEKTSTFIAEIKGKLKKAATDKAEDNKKIEQEAEKKQLSVEEEDVKNSE